MKMTKFFINKILSVSGLFLLAAGLLLLGACPNDEELLNPPDKTLLNQKIAEADAAKASVEVSNDGSDVLSGTYWVTQADFNTFNSAVNAAKSVANNSNATKAQVDKALSDLSAALIAFNSCKSNGTGFPVDSLDRSALTTLMDQVKTALASVLVSADSDGTFLTNWVTKTVYDALDAAWDSANDVAIEKEEDGNTQANIDGAVTTLQTALDTFNGSKKAAEEIGTPVAYRVNTAGDAFVNLGTGTGYNPAAEGGGFGTSGGLNVFDTKGTQDGQWKYHWFDGWWDRYLNVGYVDLGAKAGDLIAGSNWTVETIFAMPSNHPDALIDQYLWSFVKDSPVNIVGFCWREMYVRARLNDAGTDFTAFDWESGIPYRNVPFGKWTHIVVTKTPEHVTTYLNGTQLYKVPATNFASYSAGELTLNYFGKSPYYDQNSPPAAGDVFFGMYLARTGLYHFAIDDNAWNEDKVTMRYTNGPVGNETLTSWASSAVNTTALNNKITDAKAALVGITVTDDGATVDQNEFWVTTTVKSTFDTAIQTAETVKNNTAALQADVDNAVTTLNTAITTFTGAKQAGQKPTDFSVLDAKILESETELAGVETSADGEDVLQTDKWATAADKAALLTAINTAKTVANTTSEKQTDVDAAVITLNSALSLFKTKVDFGSMAGSIDVSALTTKINEAKSAITNAVVSEYGVYVTNWVTPADVTALNTAIGVAEAALLTIDTDQDVTDAVVVLNTALTTFINAKRPDEGYDTPVAYRVNTAGNGFENIGKDAGYAATVQWPFSITPLNYFSTSQGYKVFDGNGRRDGQWNTPTWVSSTGKIDRYMDAGWVSLGAKVGDIFTTSPNNWTFEIIFALPADHTTGLQQQNLISFHTDQDVTCENGGLGPGHPNCNLFVYDFRNLNIIRHHHTENIFSSFDDEFGGGANWDLAEAEHAKALGKWAHIVITKNDNTVNTYINGELIHSHTYPTWPAWHTKPGLFIDNTFGKIPLFWDGFDSFVPPAADVEIQKAYLARTGLYHYAVDNTSWDAGKAAERYAASPVGKGKLTTWVSQANSN